MAQLDFPTSPTPGQVYAATNGVNYIWDNAIGIGVWRAEQGAPLSISNPGTITGTAEIGAVLSYATGTAADGMPPYTYSWVWKLASTGVQVPGTAIDDATITIPAGALGDRVYVELTATDTASNTASATTSPYPAPPAVIAVAGITGAVAPTTIPGTASFTWADGNQNLTATGCIEFSTDAGTTWQQGPQAVTNATTVQTRWANTPSSGTCGDSAGNATITGTLTDGTATTSFSLVMDRTPSAFTLSPNTETTTPATVTTADPTFTIAGTNSPSFIWGSFATTGGTPQFTVDGGTTWAAIPTAPGTATVNPGATVSIRFTTGAAAGSEVYTVNVGATVTAGEFQSGAFTVTVASSPFPNSSFTPAGAPNASPASVSTGSLHGTASCASWADGSVSLTSTGGIVFDVNATGTFGAGPTSIVPGDSIAVIWDPAVIAGAADNATLTGTLTDGTFTNTYSIVVTRAPASLTGAFTDLDPEPLSTAKTSNIVTPTGFNVPITLTIAGTAADPLTSIGADVSGGGFLSTPQTVNPGQTIQLQGTTGTTISTVYGIDVSLGSGPAATDTWTVKTVAATPAVTTPTIATPSSGSTGVGTPSGITVTGSAYASTGGAGAQTSSTWEVYSGSHPLTSTNAITAVAQNAGSATGTWTQVASTSFSSSAVGGAVYGNGLWVAVGNDGKIGTSPDRNTWTQRSSIVTPQFLNKVAFNGVDKFVLVGETGIIWSSLDGITWIAQTSGTTDGLRGVAFGSGKWIAVGQNGTMLSSSDGVTWSPVSNGFGTSFIIAITYANGLWMAVGDVGKIETSVDGTTWVSQTSGVANSLLSVDFGAGTWVVASNTGLIKSINNGVTWTTIAGAPPNAARATYGGGLWVAGNGSGDIYTSTDVTTWTAATSSVTGAAINQVVYHGGEWLAVVNAGRMTTASSPTTTLTIAGCQTDGFLVGDTVESDPAAAGPATITAVDNTAVTVVPSSASWAIGQKLKRAPSSYTAVTGSPFTVSAAPLTSLDIPKPPLAANTQYWARVKYSTTTPSAIDSLYSPWSDFTTGSLVPTPGDLYGGGYFAGQINDGGTIYNLVVAPVEGDSTGPVTGGILNGQFGGSSPGLIQYKTTSSFDTPLPTVQNEVYGGPTTDLFKASANHGVFNSFINGASGPNAGAFNLATGGTGGGTGIGGYNDWYLPAKNELAVLYFFLKPSTNANDTSSGWNPDSVAPYTPNTAYSAGFPNQTTSTLFRVGGAERFFTAQTYWSSSEDSGITGRSWTQSFTDGTQASSLKNNLKYARAVRRVQA